MKYLARPVIDGKFWIVEDQDNKIGTLKAQDSGFVLFLKSEDQSINITTADFERLFKVVITNKSKTTYADVYGYPTGSEQVFNIGADEAVPIYTKSEASSTFYTAGWYAIFFPGIKWSSAFCPKLKTLKSYPFIGPFKTESDVNLAIKRKRSEV